MDVSESTSKVLALTAEKVERFNAAILEDATETITPEGLADGLGIDKRAIRNAVRENRIPGAFSQRRDANGRLTSTITKAGAVFWFYGPMIQQMMGIGKN